MNTDFFFDFGDESDDRLDDPPMNTNRHNSFFVMMYLYLEKGENVEKGSNFQSGVIYTSFMNFLFLKPK